MTEVLSGPVSDSEYCAELRNAAIASTVGTTIEWCDFPLYGVVASLVFGKLFFPRLVDGMKLPWRIRARLSGAQTRSRAGHFKGRGWRGFYHHATLCIAAHGFLISEQETIPLVTLFHRLFIQRTCRSRPQIVSEPPPRRNVIELHTEQGELALGNTHHVGFRAAASNVGLSHSTQVLSPARKFSGSNTRAASTSAFTPRPNLTFGRA